MDLRYLMGIDAKLSIIANNQFTMIELFAEACDDKISKESRKRIYDYIECTRKYLNNIEDITRR